MKESREVRDDLAIRVNVSGHVWRKGGSARDHVWINENATI
jgi:hypothetical protein